MKKILVTLPVEDRHKQYLASMTSGTKERASLVYIPADDITAADLSGVDAILGSVEPELLPQADRLSWLQLSWAGADSFVKPGVLKEGTILTNASGAYGLSVSEHMVAVTFALIRHLHQYSLGQARHEWKPLGSIISVEGATVLVLGLGDIGGSYARKMKALGAYVIGVRRTNAPKPEYVDEQYTVDELDSVLSRANIVAMAIPGGSATEHIIDERRLRLMKPGAFLINDGRGNAIDPDGLKRVLADGHLGGVALDVTEPEPLPADDALWDYENVIITPHISGQFLLQETFERAVRICGENLRRFCNGEPLKHVVDKNKGY